MTDPDPGQPLTDTETRVWVDAVDRMTNTYLGDLTLEQMEELVATMLERAGPDDEWAEKVADALRDRWALQRGDRLKALMEQIKRGEGAPG